MTSEFTKVMTSHIRIRLPKSLLDAGKDAAKQQNLSFSQIVIQALNPYLSGNKSYRTADTDIKETSLVISPEELSQLTALAQQANISRFEAIRLAVESYLDEQGRL